MAITFSKALGTTVLLNSHNSEEENKNEVEFSSDNVLKAVSCMVIMGSYTGEITPKP
jgi:hypothetical protein